MGFRHFTEGISSLKQVTGREHHDVQRYTVGVIAGAVTKDFLIAIRVSMDFWYLCQAKEIDDEGCDRIRAALDEFHEHKSAIVDADACVGKGNKPIKNWYIAKLEMMQSVISNIQANGAVIQYSADVTEHAHITEIKNPARAGNNQRYEAQICHDLDRMNKLHRFELATTIPNPHLTPFNAGNNTDTCEDNSGDLMALSLAQLVKGQLQTSNDYFEDAALLQNDLHALHPIRTFANTHTAFHLNRHPNFKQMMVEDAATKFGLPYLCPALVDFMHHYAPEISDSYTIGG